jgi:hypothetical protein
VLGAPDPPAHVDPKGRPLQMAEALPGAWRLVIDHYPRCWVCGRLLAERASRPWVIRCKDGHPNASGEAEPAVLHCP